jgi:hypothetical protein
MVQVVMVEQLLSKRGTVSSNPSTAKKGGGENKASSIYIVRPTNTTEMWR